jgi:hypothetical protein
MYVKNKYICCPTNYTVSEQFHIHFKITQRIQNVLKVALPKYLTVIIRRCQMCIEHAGQQFEQFL